MVRGTDIRDARRSYRTRSEGDFPEELELRLTKDSDLKYGENPNQHGAIYRLADVLGVRSVRSDGKGKGGLSLTNMMDITRAADTLRFFREGQAIAIMKHATVSGFATKVEEYQSQTDLFRLARDADLRSNFGGTVVSTEALDIETAEAMYELRGKNPFFPDVVAAPGFNEGVVGYLQDQKKELRIAEFSGLEELPRFQGDETYGLLSLKELPGGLIGVQDIYLSSIKGPKDLVTDAMLTGRKSGKKYLVERDPNPREMADLLTTWYLNVAGARSNGIVFVKDGVSVAMGSGQVERIGAVEQAIVKGMQKAMDREGVYYDPLMGIQGYEQLSKNPFEGAVCSSDGFFPFDDSIDLLARVDVSAVIQPAGSVRDHKIIEAVNKYNMAMAVTKERCFGHF
jgi:phosphoribosylaminoimidazolecarboxamide formyltransferase/IMP cyclohydrolase